MARIREILKSKRNGSGQDADTSHLFPVDDGAVAVEETPLPGTVEYEDDGRDTGAPRGRAMPARIVPKSVHVPAAVRHKHIGKSETEEAAEVYFRDARIIHRSRIFVPEDHPRTYFKPEEVRARRESLRRYGIMQPLIVRETTEGAWGKDVESMFAVIDGALRFYASLPHEEFVKKFDWAQDGPVWDGITEVPLVVRDISRDEATAIAMVLELQRSDKNPFERGAAFKKIKENMTLRLGHKVGWEEVADTLGLGRKAVIEVSRLADLDEGVRDKAIEAGLSQKQSIALVPLAKDPTAACRMVNDIVKNRWSGERAIEESRERAGVRRVPVVPVTPPASSATTTRSFEMGVTTPSMLQLEFDSVKRAVSMVAQRVVDFRARREGLRAVPVDVREAVLQEIKVLREQADELERLVA